MRNAAPYLSEVMKVESPRKCIVIINYSYRLEQAFMIDMQQNLNMEIEIAMCKYIVYAVDIHRKAMMLVSDQAKTHVFTVECIIMFVCS